MSLPTLRSVVWDVCGKTLKQADAEVLADRERVREACKDAVKAVQTIEPPLGEDGPIYVEGWERACHAILFRLDAIDLKGTP